jgi:RNA polymerase sigma-70 factor (ECF subfamily)
MNVLQFQKKLLSLQENMMNFALMLTANKDDAQDLLQDTTLKVLDNQEKFVDNINFKGWVLTVMRNIFINNYHKVARTQTVIDSEIDLYNLNITKSSGFDSPEGALQIREISNAIAKLNKDLKTPFSMFLSGYKYNEIAVKLDLPLGTVKSRIFFARQELQQELKDFKNNR